MLETYLALVVPVDNLLDGDFMHDILAPGMNDE